jgi:aryl-alcohol dehydrogenase-like predicted oxidoreductase
MSDLIPSGKVRAIGTSCFPASEIFEAQWAAERRRLERFRTEQPPYSIINRSIQREVLPVCQRYGVGALAWSPLGQGLLTRRYRKGQQADTHRSGGSMPQHFRPAGLARPSRYRQVDLPEPAWPPAGRPARRSATWRCR